MRRWSLDDIDWGGFEGGAVDADLLAVVKTAALVEANAADYVAYLGDVFRGDEAFLAAIQTWGREEEQHGAALGRWAELAEPGFDFAGALAAFRANYRVPQNVTQSIRGSRAGELVARQVVETGTSSFYSAIRDATDEPVLKAIAGRIAADEFAHYRLFQIHFARYHAVEPLPLPTRLHVAATRSPKREPPGIASNAWSSDTADRLSPRRARSAVAAAATRSSVTSPCTSSGYARRPSSTLASAMCGVRTRRRATA